MVKMTVHLLRHAHSCHALAGQRDHQRGLDPRGEREVEAIRERLRREPVQVARIVCSTAERARRTLAPLLPMLGGIAPRYDDHLYAMGVDAYVAACLADDARSPILLVGHNPTIEAFLARYGAADSERFTAGIKPGTWATLQLETDGRDALEGGRLVRITPPS